MAEFDLNSIRTPGAKTITITDESVMVIDNTVRMLEKGGMQLKLFKTESYEETVVDKIQKINGTITSTITTMHRHTFHSY